VSQLCCGLFISLGLLVKIHTFLDLILGQLRHLAFYVHILKNTRLYRYLWPEILNLDVFRLSLFNLNDLFPRHSLVLRNFHQHLHQLLLVAQQLVAEFVRSF
jgi:hypothetical protein